MNLTQRAPWWNAAWSGRVPVRVGRAKVGGRGLRNLPISVDLTRQRGVRENAKPDLSDVRFVDSSSRVLRHQIQQVGQELWRDSTTLWFCQPTARCFKGTTEQMVVSGTSYRGDANVTSYNLQTGAITSFIVHPLLQGDDHTNPSLLFLPDGNLLAAYCTHTVAADPIFIRRTTSPEDISAWNAETTTSPTAGGPAYPKLARMSAQSGRIYLHYRDDLDHAYLTSSDSGATWSARSWLIKSTFAARAYVVMDDNGVDRMDFLVTDPNPNTVAALSSQYHFYVKVTGTPSAYKSDGTLIDTLANIHGAGGITSSQMTKIQDGAENGETWSWDVAYNNGNPIGVYAVFPITDGSGDRTHEYDHRYYAARWNGTAWTHQQITPAGGFITSDGSQYSYSAGIAIDHDYPTRMFLARQTAGLPSNGQGTFELERWVAPAGTINYAFDRAITSGSEFNVKNFRPVVPRGRSLMTTTPPEVVWSSGRYTNFNSYGTRLLFFPGRSPALAPGVARVRLETPNPHADQLIHMYYGNPAATSVETDPFDTSTKQRLSNVGHTFTGLVSTEPDYTQQDVVDMSNWTAMTVRVRHQRNAGDTTVDQVFSNWSASSNVAKFWLRTRTTGAMDGFLIVGVSTQIGGPFAIASDVNDGGDHDLVLTYDLTNGLRMWVDGILSTTVVAASGNVSSGASNARTLAGHSPQLNDLPARCAVGLIKDGRIEQILRPNAWIVTMSHDRKDLVVPALWERA